MKTPLGPLTRSTRPAPIHWPAEFRVRPANCLDTTGKMSLRRAGRMHHRAHAGTRVLAFADDHHITVAELTTGEVLSTHDIDPARAYWRNTQRKPGRWPPPKN